MIKNRKLAITLAFLTFVLGSILITLILFYLAVLTISSIWQNQLYVFFAILISAILASIVYGRVNKQKSDKAAEFLNDEFKIGIRGKDMDVLLRMLRKFPPFLVNSYISKDINAVKEFKYPIKEYTDNLTNEDLLKIRKIMDMPVPKLQYLLNELYIITDLKQLEILAQPTAEQFIELNLGELKKILFKE